jgi:hypothetical protein
MAVTGAQRQEPIAKPPSPALPVQRPEQAVGTAQRQSRNGHVHPYLLGEPDQEGIGRRQPCCSQADPRVKELRADQVQQPYEDDTQDGGQ